MKSKLATILESYPFLFILHTYLAFRVLNPDANIGLFFDDLNIILIIVIAGAILLFWLLRWNLNLSRASFTLFAILYWAGNYGSILLLMEISLKKQFSIRIQILLFIIWSLIWFFLCSSLLWKYIQKPKTISSYMSMLMFILVLISGWQLIQRFQQESQMEQIFPPQTIIPLKSEQMPDIYYIIADGYGRNDIYSTYYNLDNSHFTDSLKARGFYIATESYSNYVRTKLSIASSLNINYLPTIPFPSSGNKVLKNWINNNVVMESLKTIGYQIISFESKYYYSNIEDVDGLIPINQASANLFKVILQTRSVGRLLLDLGLITPIETFHDYQELSFFQVKQLSQIARLDRPKFVFLHFLQPHPSFIFDSKGPITPEKSYALVDADDVGLPLDDYIKSLREQTLFTNKLLLEAVDNILENSTTDPIIILQGDHGGGAFFIASSLEKSCMSERASILNAYHLPQYANQKLLEDITPVNSFRLIFNRYFQTNLPILENKTYFSPINHEFSLTDVTNRLSETCIVP